MACSRFTWCVSHSSTPPGGTVHHGEAVQITAGDDVLSVALVSDQDTADVYLELRTGTADPVLLTASEAYGLTEAVVSRASTA